MFLRLLIFLGISSVKYVTDVHAFIYTTKHTERERERRKREVGWGGRERET